MKTSKKLSLGFVLLYCLAMLGGCCWLNPRLDRCPPIMVIFPTSLDFGTDKNSMIFSIKNNGGKPLEWTASKDQPWITLSPLSDSTTSETDQVEVTVDRNAVVSGRYNGKVTINSNDRVLSVRILMIVEDCVSFNPNTTTVENIDGHWKIVDGSHWMFDFDNKESEAQRALGIIKHYGMNQSCFVGRPDPSFHYMLVSGEAPTGSMPGEDCVSFNPNTTTVENIDGHWKIVDGSHWMFDFDNKESEAKEALAIIKRYGFRYSCFVGRPDSSFQYLRK